MTGSFLFWKKGSTIFWFQGSIQIGLGGQLASDFAETNKILQNLMMAVLDLSKITDQPIKETGPIAVHYNWVTEKLFRLQWNVSEIVSEIDLYSVFVNDILKGKYLEIEEKLNKNKV